MPWLEKRVRKRRELKGADKVRRWLSKLRRNRTAKLAIAIVVPLTLAFSVFVYAASSGGGGSQASESASVPSE